MSSLNSFTHLREPRLVKIQTQMGDNMHQRIPQHIKCIQHIQLDTRVGVNRPFVHLAPSTMIEFNNVRYAIPNGGDVQALFAQHGRQHRQMGLTSQITMT